MRKRSYRPEVLDCLEDRALMSGVGRPEPVLLSRLRYIRFGEHTRAGFILFARDGVVEQLEERLRDSAAMIPFARVDGLGPAVNDILDRMEENILAGEPHAIREASNGVLAAARAIVRARVAAGDVVVR